MELTRVKDGLWVPTDFKKYHGYYADEKGEKEYTGVTSVLGVVAKPALIGWAARMACEHIREKWMPCEGMVEECVGKSREEIDTILEEARTAHTKKKEAAGEHGTSTHELVEKYIKDCIEVRTGVPIIGTVLDDNWASIKPFIAWAMENVDRFLFSERRMCDPALWLAGTCDLAYIDKEGRRVISDFKTSGSGIYFEMWLQAAAYQMLAEGEGDEKYDYRSIIRLDRTGEFEVQVRHDYETDKEAFLATLKLYRAMATFKRV